MITTHRLPEASFADLAAGYGDTRTVRMLRDGQLSKHLLLLRGVLDAASGAGGVDDAYALLAAAGDRDRDAVAAVLVQPHVGAWAVSCLRRLRAGDATAPDDLSHLGAVAVTAAVTAGLDFRYELRARDGAVTFPGLGRLGTATPTVAVRGRDGVLTAGSLRLSGTGSVAEVPGWAPPHRLSAGGTGDGTCGGPVGWPLRLVLDDVDPYRDCHGLGADDRLAPQRVAEWTDLLNGAWRMLADRHPRYAEAIAAGLSTLVPLRAEGYAKGISATSRDTFGAVSLSRPVDDVGFAVTLVHEFQHAKLSALLDMVPMYDERDTRRFYAPWRDDPRPVGGLLQGVYAFLGVADFWRVQRSREGGGRRAFAEFEFARWRERVSRMLDLLQETGALRPDGLRFVAGMRDTVDGWHGERVSPTIAAAAGAAADDHRTGWRVRNLRVEDAGVRRLAQRWRAGAPPGGPEPRVTIVPTACKLEQNARIDLVRLGITDPERLPAEMALAEGREHGADAAFAAGRFADAAAGYRQRIRHDPDDAHSWAGLALACQRIDPERYHGFIERPEIVAALYRTLGDVEPTDLAAWFAGV